MIYLSLEQILSKGFSLVNVWHLSCYCAYLLEIIFAGIVHVTSLEPLGEETMPHWIGSCIGFYARFNLTSCIEGGFSLY